MNVPTGPRNAKVRLLVALVDLAGIKTRLEGTKGYLPTLDVLTFYYLLPSPLARCNQEPTQAPKTLPRF